ncbi:MAG TPA: ACT domain-containing protein [Acidimicrobiales bacterium]|nr:ACT domain-containing protein [Acidimicrobiales bacterium]
MISCIVRIWLPDRPGALGEVATAIGSVGAEIVGIDILERGAGRAIDELAVELPEHGVPPLLAVLRRVDGVDVEDLRIVDGTAHDPRSDALELAAMLAGAGDRDALLDAVVTHGRRLLGGDWAAVLRLDDGEVRASGGPAPEGRWLVAFVEGSRTSARVAEGRCGPEDVVWAPLPGTSLALVVGRDGAPFRARERRQASALARIADARLQDLSRRAHPSTR